MRPKSDSKDASLRQLGRLQPDQHIPGMAGFLFAICMLACFIGVFVMTQNAVGDALIGTWTVALDPAQRIFPVLAQDRLAVGESRRPAHGKIP